MSDSPIPLSHSSVDSPSDPPSADDITIIPDGPGPDAVSQQTAARAAAEESVQALLDDLAYVSTQLPPEQRPDAAQAVLAHHHPPIEEALLSTGMRSRQREAIRLLRQLSGHRARAAGIRVSGAEQSASVTAHDRPSSADDTSAATPVISAQGRALPVSAQTLHPPRSRWSLKHVSRAALLAVALAVLGFLAGRVIQQLT